jgi:hypothetical protein
MYGLLKFAQIRLLCRHNIHQTSGLPEEGQSLDREKTQQVFAKHSPLICKTFHNDLPDISVAFRVCDVCGKREWVYRVQKVGTPRVLPWMKMSPELAKIAEAGLLPA